MAESSELPSSAKVRDLIFAYERQASSTKPLEEYNGRPRAKSIGNALSYKQFRQSNVEFHSISDIEKELVKIETHLNYYEVYEKETHVAFQEQLFNVLTSLVNIDPDDQDGTTQLKKKLILETQKIATDLNSRLPYDGNHSYKGVRRTYNTFVRKEEAVVSTTSIKSQEHRAILSSQSSTIQNSTLNGSFRSEESLNSIKDSVDLSSRQDESSIDFNYLEDTPQSSTPPPQKLIVDDTQPGILPSVSKLKQFFSFRRETKPEVKVTSASYSGLSRSQSLSNKPNKYAAIKRNKKEDARKKEKAISESDEVIDRAFDQEISSSSQIINSSTTINTSQTINSSQTINVSQTTNATSNKESLEINASSEPTMEVKESVEEQIKSTNNVSVSKLKNLFEKNRNETNEGLGLLTKRQTEFSSALDLPFTALNLGAYRLKRTISGNYMNFTGLIRNVDISKKGDLSKSKSLSDLKITNQSYGARDLEDDYVDLSQEIDDNDDFEHVSINVGKETDELNNNVVRNEVVKENVNTDGEPPAKERIEVTVGSSNVAEHLNQEVSTTETSHTVRRETESIILSKSVETLKREFENLKTSSGSKSTESNEEIKHVIHKTKIEPVTSSVHSEITENSNTMTSHKANNDDVRHIIHRTIEPFSSTTNGPEEPKLKVPIQLRPGFVNVTQSQEASSEITEVTGEFIRNERIHHTTSEVVTSAGIVGTINQSYEYIGPNKTNDVNNEEIRHIIHRTIEPISSSTNGIEEPVLKVPIQLRMGFGNVNKSNEAKENMKDESSTENINIVQESSDSLASSGTVEILTQTFENLNGTRSSEVNNDDIKEILHRTIEPIQGPDHSEEPVLKIPVQLRIGIAQESHSREVTENLEVVEQSIQNTNIVQETSDDSLTSPGTVEILTQTFENLSSTNSSEVNNDDIKHILHRTIEPIQSTDGSQEPILKVPIQLRLGLTQESSSHQLTENLEVETNVENTNIIQQTGSDSLASPGTVEVLTQTFENLSSTNSSEVNNDDIKHILHKTIEPIQSTDGSQEPILKVPIQLRLGLTQESSSHQLTENLDVETNVENTNIIQQTGSDSLASPGTVEVLTQTFENLSSTNNAKIDNDNIESIIHRTIEPIQSSTDGSEEPILKVPVQLRIGLTQESHSQQVTEHLEVVEGSTENTNSTLVTSGSLASPGTVEVLTQTFENFNTTSSTEGNNDAGTYIIHRTIEPIPSVDSSEEPEISVPITLRTGFVNVSQAKEVSENFETVETGDISDVTDVFLHNERRHSHELSDHNIEISHQTSMQESTQHDPILKTPIQFRIGNNIATTDEIITSNDGSMSRARIEEKTGSFMRVLEAPTEFSSIVSSSSLSQSQQASSTSSMSVSYSESRTVQHKSSTHVSQRIVSSSSSSLTSQESSQSFLEVLKEPVSYSLLSSINSESPNDVSEVSITEVDDEVSGGRRKIKVNLNVSQENIIDEILMEGDSLENIDEEFQRVLEENTK